MAYKYDRSEAFRAQSFFYIGAVWCTPFCLEVLRLVQHETNFNLMIMLIDLLLFGVGYLLIQGSYSIMKKRDDYNDSN